MRLGILAAVVGATLLVATAHAKLHAGPPIMLSNLSHMNGIMRGLALTDLSIVAEHARGIKANAQALQKVKVGDLKTDIADSKQADFVKYAQALEREAAALEEAANQGNPGKVLEAHKNMIANGCFACHSKVRDP
jgi:hypothetical protein